MQCINVIHGPTNTSINLTIKQLELSGLLTNIFTFFNNHTIKIEHVSEDSFKKCMEYLQYNVSNKYSDQWNVDFIDKILQDSYQLDKLYELMIAADYMMIYGLVDLCAYKFSWIINHIEYKDVVSFHK